MWSEREYQKHLGDPDAASLQPGQVCDITPTADLNARRSQRLPLLAGATMLLLLAPLSFLGDLRIAFHPYLTLTISATLLLYGLLHLLDRRGIELPARHVLGIALLLRLAVLPMEPSLSDDAYRYLWDGRLVLEGVCPFDHVPADTLLRRFHDELYRVQGYPTTSTVYPPGAQLVFAAGVALGKMIGDSWLPGYYALKALLVAGEMVAIWLMLRLLAHCGLRSRHALLYAWHPLAIVEIAGQGHTDAFWALALALGLYGYARGHAGRGIVGVALGAVTRLFPLVLVPLWLRFAERRERIVGIILATPLLLLFIPLFDLSALRGYLAVIERFTNYYEFNGGFYYGLKSVLDELSVSPSNRWGGAISTGVQLVLLTIVLTRPLRDRSTQRLAWLALLVVTIQIVFTAKAHVWYFTAPLFLLPLASSNALRGAWMWVALVAPVTYVAYTIAPVHEPAGVLWLEWGGFAMLALAGLYKRERPLVRERAFDDIDASVAAID